MRDFTRPRGRLRGLPLPARVVYSVFLAFTVVAMGLTAWLGAEMVGADLARVGAYYAGKTEARVARGAAPTVAAAGPVLELPPEADAAPAVEPMPLRKLLEVTHFHLFSMPVYLLILSHLYMLSRASDRTKVTWIALATLGVAAHLAAPWIARSGATASRAAYGGSGALMTASLLVMTLVPLYEMWAPHAERPQSADPS